MDVATLRAQTTDEIERYLWLRLRREGEMDPPIAERFSEEPPEQFLFRAVRETGDQALRGKVIEAIRRNLRKLAVQQTASDRPIWRDPTTDQQLASLAFLASALEASELASLHELACPWMLADVEQQSDLTDGQFHILRTLAQLQKDSRHAGFWKTLWETAPASARAIVFFGWARADPAALLNLPRLLESVGSIDLPTTLWAIAGPLGPGLVALAQAARALPAGARAVVRSALETAGATPVMIRDFDLTAEEAAESSTRRFQFPAVIAQWMKNRPAPTARPSWDATVPAFP